MMYGDHMSAGGWLLSICLTLIVVGLVVAGFIWLASARARRRPARDIGLERGASAREILERRLASGEITAEHYDEVCAKLSGASASSPDPLIGPVGAT